MADFLLEIGLEEVPARMVAGAEAELARRVGELLARERLAADGKVEAFSTPRRLAVLARGIAARQPDVEEQVTGPSLKVAYKDGAPTPAALAFARKVGVAPEKLEKVSTPKGEYLGARVVSRGRNAGEVLAEALPKEIAGLYWAKSMYWRGKNGERFVRPVRWLVALLDGDLVPLEFAGVRAGYETHGHRLMHAGTQRIPAPGEYARSLEGAGVVPTRSQREHRIRKALDAATRAVPGAHWREDAALLEAVVNLTEWPGVILGSFDREFLALPEEVLVTVMRDHQKYFAVEDASGRLAPHFLAVLNREGDPGGIIRHGNERVLRARFNDARFFWDADQKMPLRQRVDMLKHVTFQKDLGSYYEKSRRISDLAEKLVADLLDMGVEVSLDATSNACWLAKTDLTTELVKEFTELQGLVGGLYAKAQGLDTAIADAIYDQYKPESMEDAAPRTIEGAVLSLVDKADSIAGMFALGLQPTGSKDPFALRRQANGMVRILAEHKLPLSLRHIFTHARDGYRDAEAEKKFRQVTYLDAIAAFFRERLEFYLREALGLEYDTVNATLAAGADHVPDVVARARALSEARRSEDFAHISIAFKRMKNILRQAKEKKVSWGDFDPALTQDEAERKLAADAAKVAPVVQELSRKADYRAALTEISKLRPVVDVFFDKVMVMVEDEKLRSNRLGLLEKVLSDFSTIADFSEIVTEGKT